MFIAFCMINLCFDAASQVCLRHRDLFQTRKLAAKECVPLDLCLVREVLRVTRRTLQDSTIVTTPVTPDSDPAASTSDPWGTGWVAHYVRPNSNWRGCNVRLKVKGEPGDF